jgi:hypothetical protein
MAAGFITQIEHNLEQKALKEDLRAGGGKKPRKDVIIFKDEPWLYVSHKIKNRVAYTFANVFKTGTADEKGVVLVTISNEGAFKRDPAVKTTDTFLPAGYFIKIDRKISMLGREDWYTLENAAHLSKIIAPFFIKRTGLAADWLINEKIEALVMLENAPIPAAYSDDVKKYCESVSGEPALIDGWVKNKIMNKMCWEFHQAKAQAS